MQVNSKDVIPREELVRVASVGSFELHEARDVTRMVASIVQELCDAILVGYVHHR